MIKKPKYFSATPLWMVMALLLLLGRANASEAIETVSIFSKDARILFQGDSITDGNRGRSADPNHILGHGYAFIIAAKYGLRRSQPDVHEPRSERQ